MAIVTFTLSESGVAAFQNALACIMKFSDDVSLEARREKLVLTALNSSQSAYLSFTFAANRFFSRYSYGGPHHCPERFFCVLYIRALLSVFRSRMGGDPSREREKDTSIERCDVSIEDGPGVRSRFVATIVCRNGITATHALPFEAKPPTHAKFHSNEAVHHWAISSRTLRQMMAHFGPRIELLDINTQGVNVVNFACFSEKQFKAEDFLNKPLHTSIAVDVEEFDDFEVEGKHHIVISVKDFRAILQHASNIGDMLSASYSKPGSPMRLSYSGDGLACEFVLMTVGEKWPARQTNNHGSKKVAAAALAPAPEAAPASRTPVAQVDRRPAPAVSKQPVAAKGPPPQRYPQFEMRPPPIPPSTLRSESLFVPANDDDQWEPVNPEDDHGSGGLDRLEWDASNQPDPSTARISIRQDTEPEAQDFPSVDPASGLQPTQQLSNVRKFALFSG